VGFTFKQVFLLGEVESLTLVIFIHSFMLFRVVFIFASLVFDWTTIFGARLKYG
jgi:hypothetical protein